MCAAGKSRNWVTAGQGALHYDITPALFDLNNFRENTKHRHRHFSEKNTFCFQEWRKRKRICMNIVDAILENYPKSKKVLFEEIGLETEEDLGIKIPDV